MKNKLLDLELPENVVDEIIGAYDMYQQTLDVYSKPAGPKAFKDRIEEIEILSHELSEKLKQLTDYERQQLLIGIDASEFAKRLRYLSSCCGYVKQKDINSSFNRKEPFLSDLGLNIKGVLEKHGIPVKIYRGNVFCSVLDILLNQKAGEKSFNLLRQVCKKHS